MIDQNIGKPEITRKHLSELQTFYEAQLVAKRHYDALKDSMKPLQDAADVLRASGVVNVDALLSQPVSATKAMIDEMEAGVVSDDLRAKIDAAVAEHLTDERNAEGWVFVGYDGRDVTGGDEWLREYMPSMDGSGCIDQDCWWGDDMWSLENVDHRIIAVKPPEGYELRDGLVQKIETDQLNDLTPHEGEEEEDAFESLNKAADVIWKSAAEIDAPAYETVTGTETDFPPMPEGEGWEKNTGKQPFDAWVEVDTVTFGGDTDTCDCGLYLWEFQDSENDIAWYRKAQQAASETVDHAAEATAQIEAQAEPESTETEADHFVLDANGRKLRVGDRVIANSSVRGLGGAFEIEEIAGDEVIGKAGMFTSRLVQLVEAEPDTAETMQAIAEVVEVVDAEPEAATEETVTEQPETVEAEPETPTEPKAERKSYDFTGDFTQEEILAQSGATAPAIQNQPDDIAATERAEFDAPQRQFYNPWAKTEKAEG